MHGNDDSVTVAGKPVTVLLKFEQGTPHASPE